MQKIFKNISFYLRRTDGLLWFITILTSIYCLLLLKSVSRVPATDTAFSKQLFAIAVGYFGAVLVTLIDYRVIANYWKLIALVCLALFIITTVIYIKRKNIDNEKQEDIANNETHENIKIDGITSDKIEITTSSQNATTSSYIKESLFGFSMIFLIFTIIFGIIFAKHQQKRKIKRLNNRKG